MNQEFQQQLIGELVTYFQSGEGFANKTELQKFASRFYGKPILPGMVETKIIEECAEKALVQVSGTLLDQSETTHEAFDKLVDLYERQPNLSTRTSDSVRRQAYSTPLPIAFLASSLANIQPGKTVYEPTAGNGALLLNADRKLVYANEIYDDRIAQLKEQGFGTITQVDGTTHKPPEQVDVVVLNPPYGTVKENGKTKTWIVSGGKVTPSYRTSQIDQVIAFKALEAMKDDGRAVLILPAPMEQKTGNQEGASNSYNSSQNIPFWLSLYRNYNVTEHFTVHGDLYAAQGTAYPVDVVVIEGRGRSPRMLPAADLPAVYRSFKHLKELLPNEPLLRNRQSISPTNRRDNHSAIAGGVSAEPTEPSQEPGGLDGSAVRPSGVDDPQVDGRRRADGSGSISADLPDRRPGRTDPTRVTGNGRFNPGLGGSTNGRQPGSPGNGQVSQPDRPPTGNPISRFPNRTPDRSPRPDRANSRDDSNRVAGTNDSRMQGRDELDPTQQQPQQQPQQAATTEGKTMADQEQAQPQSQDTQATQVPYVPRSKARSAGTLLPVNMNTAVQKSLRDLEARVGSIDAYMEAKVKVSEMPVQPFAEQLDSIALAIDNLERGEAFILGDQTGIGKGLQLAEIAKAQMNRTIALPENVKNLVFVTYDSKLYADFIRDLNDVGITNVKPLITNSDFKMTTPSGDKLRTANSKQHTELLTRLANEGDLGNYNIVFTTYSQLQTVKGEDTVRRDFLRRIAKDSLMILDESHNAGGTQTEFASGKPTRADFVRELVAQAGGVVFSSATYAKNPYTMTLYASRTGMRHAVEDSSSFVGMVSAGGVPLQQMLASTLTAQGQYIRRERSYEGIEFGARVAEVDKDVAQNMSTVMSRIMEFDRLKRSAVKSLHKQAKEAAERVGEDGSTGAAGAKSTNFTSLMHNVINQGLLSLKADEAAERCIAALENGEKPVLTLANTMGSFIGRAAEEQDLEVGDEIALNFGDVLTRYLERSRDVVIKDAWGNKTRRPLTYDELGDEAVEHYEETLGLINSIDWSEMPISPIDYIRQKVEEAGYTTGEVTGREDRIRYEDGEQYYAKRSTVETSTAGAVDAVADFNAGNIDLMILNRSGSTGISLHASERFDDQRPRRMIIAQPELDINQFMQMLGRVHRTGQVELPRFELLMGDIPAEKRPGAVLLKKMASLNANTTAARESGFSMGDITDFMNDYGDRVAVELMNNNPELHAKLGYPISELNTSEEVNIDTIDTEGAVNKVTGRIPLLPLEEQDAVYALLESEYNELVENERALGNSILEAETLDLDAKPLMRMEVMPKLDVGGVFGEAVHLEIMDAKSPRKPLTQLEVTNLLRRNVGLTEVEDINEHDPETFLNDNRAQSRAQVQEIRNKALDYSRRYAATIARDVKLDYPAPEDEEKAKDLIAKKVEKLQDKINRQFALVSRTLQDYPIGQTVRVVGRDGTIYYGAVQEVVNKGSGRGNPLTPADWKLKLQLADGARQMTIPFSKLNAEKQGIQVEQRDADYDGNDIYELFDIKQTQSREKRQIFTGNVIRAYEKYQGKLINFTDSNGRVRQGLLMRKGFDIEAELAKQPVKMPTPRNCTQFFEVTNYSGMLKTKDSILSVVGSGDGSITITCPKAKDMGGRYYLDNNLLNRMPGREFVSVGQEMRVWIPPEDAQNVLDYFYQPGKGGLLAYSQQEKARELLGINLPKLEEVTLEELQAMADELPPIIDEPTTVNELQATIAGLEQSLNATNIADLEAALVAEIDESQIPEAEQISQDEPYAVQTEDGYLLIRNEYGVYSDGDLDYTLEDLEAEGTEYTALTKAEVESLNQQEAEAEQPYALLTDDGYLLVQGDEGVYSDGDSTYTAQELQELAAGDVEFTALNREMVDSLVQRFGAEQGLDSPSLAEVLSSLNQRDGNGETTVTRLLQTDIEERLEGLGQQPTSEASQEPIVLSMFPTTDAADATAVFAVQPDVDQEVLLERLGDTLARNDSDIWFSRGVAENLAEAIEAGDLDEPELISEAEFLQQVADLVAPAIEAEAQQQPTEATAEARPRQPQQRSTTPRGARDEGEQDDLLAEGNERITAQQQPQQQVEPVQPDQPTYYLLVPGNEPLIGPFAEWDDADLFRRQNPDFKTTPIRDFDFVQSMLPDRGSLTAEGYQQAVLAKLQAEAVAAAQEQVDQFLQEAGLSAAMESGLDLTSVVIGADTNAPVVLETDQSGRLFITRYQDTTVTENGMVFSSQEMDLVDRQLVIGSNGQLREVAVGQAGVPEYNLQTSERTLTVTTRENVDAAVATEFIGQLRADGFVESIQAVLQERQQQLEQQRQLEQQQQLEVEQHLLLSPIPADMIERADQIDKVGPFANQAEIDQFFVRFSDLGSQSSVGFFNVGSNETWELVRAANNQVIDPQTFLQTFEREVVVEVTGIDPEREEERQAAIEAEVEERLNEIWTPGFAEQLQAVNNASPEAVAEARELAVDLLVSQMIGGESFEDAYAGVTDQLNEAIATFDQPEVVEAEASEEVPLEIETLKAESLARQFLQLSGFGQNGMSVVEDISNRELFELSLTHPDYPNAQPLVISKIDDIVYFEQRLNESVGAGNKSLQYRLVNEGTEMVLIDTIVGGNGKYSPEAARIQFEGWMEMGYPALVQQQYPELVQQPEVAQEVAQPEVEAVAQAEPAQEVAPPEPVAAVDEPLIIEPLLDGQEPVANVPQMIAESANQSGRAERNIAKFLHEIGMAEVILKGIDDPNMDEGFHLRIENPPMMPLVVERHDNLLYVTHYRVPQHELDDWVMDAEMVFNISDAGTLKLTETSVQNPIKGGELRTTGIRANRGFAETFSRNILDQGFVEAAKTALAAKLEGQQSEVETPIAEAVGVETTVEVEAEPAIAEVETSVEEPTPIAVEPEPVVAKVPQPEMVEPVATTTPEAVPEATVKALDPREDIIAQFRDRIAKGTHTRITSKDLEQLVTHFVDDISRLSHKDEIKERCATEIALLEEGYPQRSISSKYMPIYRKAVSTAIENGVIELNDENSHTVNGQSRDGSQSVGTPEHFALTYFKYNQRTYEQLRNGVADTRAQQASEVEKPPEVVIPASPVVEAGAEIVATEIVTEVIEQEPSPIAEDVSEVAPVETVIPIKKGRTKEARTSTEEAVEAEAPAYSESEVDAFDAMGFNPLEITQQMLAEYDPQTLVALQKFSQSREAKENRYSPSLKEMADWLSSARALGRDGAYLNRISQLTNKVLEGTDEVFVSPEDRNPYARNEDFTLSNAAYQAMRRDLDQSRAASVAEMAKGILAVGGKDNGQQVLFERPNGNYRIVYDKQSKTLTIESRNVERGVILSEVDGTIAHQSITDIDQQIFKAFTDRVQQLTSAPKVAAGQER